MIVLIDTGATHNFISLAVLDRIELQPLTTSSYGVSLGTGTTVRTRGVCRGVVLRLLHLEVLADFLPLELGSADIILGVQWLRTLGRFQIDFQKLEMRFTMVDFEEGYMVDFSLFRTMGEEEQQPPHC